MARRGSGQRNSAKTYYMRMQTGALSFFDTERSRNTSKSRKPILLRGAFSYSWKCVCVLQQRGAFRPPRTRKTCRVSDVPTRANGNRRSDDSLERSNAQHADRDIPAVRDEEEGGGRRSHGQNACHVPCHE